MARLTTSILGEIRGKMGNLVIRKMNGKEFISLRPAKHRKTNKKVPARQKMQTAVQFSRTINNSDELKLIWGQSTIKATNPYQKLIKHSLENAEPQKLTINNKITPAGISLSYSQFYFENGELNVSINNSDKGTRSITKNNFSVYILFYFYEPKVKKTDSSRIELISKFVNGTVENNFLFNYDVGSLNTRLLKNYNRCIVYFAIVGQKTNTKAPNYSDTIAKEFVLD
jgi:hypothetical protein